MIKRRFLRSASTSTMSRPSATRAAAGIPIRCARRALAAQAGADGITAHLREDRRHITDDDIERLMGEIDLPLNLEMAATDEMLAIALRHRPHAACIVPEKREERTTEGGLDAVGAAQSPAAAWSSGWATPASASRCSSSPTRASSRRRCGSARRSSSCTPAPIARPRAAERAAPSCSRIVDAAAHAEALGLECHAGHGLTYDNVGPVAAIPTVRRAQHRPLPDRRGDLRRPRKPRSGACAR